MQIISNYSYEYEWPTVTQRMSNNLAAEVLALADLHRVSKENWVGEAGVTLVVPNLNPNVGEHLKWPLEASCENYILVLVKAGWQVVQWMWQVFGKLSSSLSC